LAGGSVVPPAGLTPVQHVRITTAKRRKTLEPKKALLASLGMGLIDALRKAESENGVPPAASFTRRLSKGTQERYSAGWRKLGDLVRESPRILQETEDDSSQTKMLTRLLSCLQASEPSAQTILTNTNRAYRRAHPSVAADGPRTRSACGATGSASAFQLRSWIPPGGRGNTVRRPEIS